MKGWWVVVVFEMCHSLSDVEVGGESGIRFNFGGGCFVAQYSGLINSNEFHCLFCSGKSDGESSRNFLQQPVSLSIIPPFVI